jgi:hypothetical protein
VKRFVNRGKLSFFLFVYRGWSLTVAVSTVVWCGLGAAPAHAGLVDFSGSSATLTSVSQTGGEGTLTPIVPPPTTATLTNLSDGFTVSNLTITYISNADGLDDGHTVEINYIATRSVNLTAGSYIDKTDALVIVTAPIPTQVGGINIGTLIGGIPGSVATVGNPTTIPSGTQSYSGSGTQGFGAPAGPMSLVQTGEFTIVPTAANQTFTFDLPATSQIYAVPEPGSIVFCLVSGLTAVAMAASVRRRRRCHS